MITAKSRSFDPQNQLIDYEVQFNNKKTITTTREFICPLGELDPTTLPSIFQGYKIIAQELYQENLTHFLRPKALYMLQEDYIESHTKLNHTLDAEMFDLCEHDFLAFFF